MERVTEICSMSPNHDDVIIVRVDFTGMPSKAKDNYIERVKTELSTVFPNNKIVIINSGIALNISHN